MSKINKNGTEICAALDCLNHRDMKMIESTITHPLMKEVKLNVCGCHYKEIQRGGMEEIISAHLFPGGRRVYDDDTWLSFWKGQDTRELVRIARMIRDCAHTEKRSYDLLVRLVASIRELPLVPRLILVAHLHSDSPGGKWMRSELDEIFAWAESGEESSGEGED